MLQTQGFAEIRAHERGVIWRMNRENKEEKSGAAHRVATVVGAVLCVILLPILIINVTLIIRSFTNRDEVPSVGGIFPLIVLTDSMYPDIQSGDLIFCHTEAPENIKIGDYIVFFDPAGNGTSIVTHSVVGISEQNGGIAWITRGIANNADDTMPVPADKLVGVYKSRISKLGNVVMFIDTVLSHSGNIAYYCDYTIVYQSLDDDTFEPEGDCASTYRVESHIGGTGSKICGYHTDSGFKQAAFVALPEYTKDGYNYMGWRIADGGEAVKELTTQSGNLILTPVMEPMDVTIKLDLGFDPDIYNSDQDESGNLPQRTSEVKAKVDEEPCFQRLSDSDISLTAGKSAILISCPCLWKVRAQAIQFCMETATWWKMAVSALIW